MSLDCPPPLPSPRTPFLFSQLCIGSLVRGQYKYMRITVKDEEEAHVMANGSNGAAYM